MPKSNNPDKPRELRSILVIDDDPDYRALCAVDVLPRAVAAVATAEQGYELARHAHFDLALVDLFLESRAAPESKPRIAWGLDVVEQLRREHSEMLLVLVSGGSSLAFAEAAREAGANATVPKQFFGPRMIALLIEEGKLADLERECMPRKPMTQARAEYEHLTRVYVDCDRNASRAIDALGISRSTFYRKLRGPWPDE
jgi:ActR/RegA family two-component response regulator